jgi:hypothetical protein
MSRGAAAVIFIIIIIVLVILFSSDETNIITSLLNYDKQFIKTSAQTIAKDFIKSEGIKDFIKIGSSLDIQSLIDECVENLFKKILENNNNAKAINTFVLGPDDWSLIGYDSFVDMLGTLDPSTEISSTLNNEINNMKSGVINNYDILYSQNNSTFPNIIGPFHTKTDEEILDGLKKATTEYINKDIQDFIKNFNSDLLVVNIDQIIDNYIISDPNYKDNFSKFSEEKLKPYIISELPNIVTNVYNKKKENIKTYLTTRKGILDIKNILCKELGGSFIDNSCSFDLKDDCDNFYKWPLTDPSNNIFTTFNNNICLTSAHSGLRNLIEQNATDDDITYDSEYEKANISNDYCDKKGLEVTTDLEGNIDCKLTKNKSILESIVGAPLIDTINKKYDKNDYEQCNTDEIDGADTIPDDLKQFVNPLVKKYGTIEKSLCFDKTYGCTTDKEFLNDVCYIKCPDGNTRNPNNKSECYKLYPTFENNGELQNADLVTKKTINNPYLPKDVCPDGYNYNQTEKKCIGNCPPGFTYKEYSNCKSVYPAKWDGAKTEIDITKNAIWSRSKVKEMKCKNPNKPEMVDGLCYAKCPSGHVRVPGAPYTCRPETCPEGYHLTGVNTCYRHPATTTPWYTKGVGISPWVCPPGHVNHAGVCWEHNYDRGAGRPPDLEPCPPGQRDDKTSCWEDAGSKGYWNYTGGCGTHIAACWDGRHGCHWDCYRTWIINGCGCIKKKVWERYRCNSDEVLRVALCYPACAPGYEEATLTNCRFVGNFDGQPAGCPSDRENKSGMCQPKCADGYWSSSDTTCSTHCPSGYYKTVFDTCQLDADTWPNPNIGAGDSALTCPDDTQEQNGICYPTNPPEGYQRHSISIEQWTEKCPIGWEDTGWICIRPTIGVDKKDAVCPSNYNDIGDDKCKKECEPGYEFKDEKCIQKCPDGTVDNTETTCGREKTMINSVDYEIPYKYRIKKRINDYLKKNIDNQ